MIATIFSSLAAVATLSASFLWIKACRIEVMLSDESKANQQRVDVVGTYELVAKWGTRAAATTAMGTLLASVSFVAQALRWP